MLSFREMQSDIVITFCRKIISGIILINFKSAFLFVPSIAVVRELKQEADGHISYKKYVTFALIFPLKFFPNEPDAKIGSSGKINQPTI